MLGKLAIYIHRNKIRPVSLIVYKNRLKWIKYLHVRIKTMKPPEENMGESSMTLIWQWFFGCDFKSKVWKVDLTSTKNHLHSKENNQQSKENKQQSKETTCRMGENVCKWQSALLICELYICRFNQLWIRNIQKNCICTECVWTFFLFVPKQFGVRTTYKVVNFY
jgi:hypothetical protein